MSNWFSEAITGLCSSNSKDAPDIQLKLEAERHYHTLYPDFDFSAGHVPTKFRSESFSVREWVRTALRSPTGQDRIFAMAYLVNKYPMHSLRYLDNLLSLISPAKNRDCIRAIDVVYQLFERSLLPRERGLISFDSRSVDFSSIRSKLNDRDNILSLWYFENELKNKFHRFVGLLEHVLMSDTVESFKSRALNALIGLAQNFHEQKERILKIVINKLGDRNVVFASSVLHKLRLLMGKHPYLTSLLIQEIRSFLFRSNLLDRAQYLAVVLLSCLQLRKCDHYSSSEVAMSLVKVYISFFKTTTKQNELPRRLAAVLLTGLSRAAPFLPENRLAEVFEEIDDIFRLVHTSGFNVALQALSVLFQLSTDRAAIRDRYYQVLYRKLRDPALLSTSRGPSILHLIYRSMLADTDADRRAAFTLRILQLCLLHCSPAFIIGCLILLSKVQVSKKNLIVTSQIPSGNPKSDTQPDVSVNGRAKCSNKFADDEDEDESFSDATESDTDSVKPTSIPTQPTTISWDHRKLFISKTAPNHSRNPQNPDRFAKLCYNPNAREPLFARAGGCPSWPLILLVNHAHPTVSLLSKQLLHGERLMYTGNPFDDFSLIHYLDRFAFKNPKTIKKPKRKLTPGRLLQRQHSHVKGSGAVSVNSAMFQQMSINRVAADEQFFHKYFTFISSRKPRNSKKRSKTDDDSDGSISDEEFDDYLEKYEKGLVPKEDQLDIEDHAFDLGGDEDLSEHSLEDLDVPDSEDETKFAEMDGLQESSSRREKNQPDDGSDSADDDFDMNVDLDADEDDLFVSAPESDGDEDDLFASAPESDGDDGSLLTNKNQHNSKWSNVFASAEQVGQLYNSKETSKQRKRRLWEEKRVHSPADKKTRVKSKQTSKQFNPKRPSKSNKSSRQPKRKRHN